MYIKVTGLYIGQGMSNLIEIYETKNDAAGENPTFKGLILIDCGSAGKEGKAGGAENEPNTPIALDYLTKKITQNHGTLTAIILSHLDDDHINKIAVLIGEGDSRILKKVEHTLIGGTHKSFKTDDNIFRNSTCNVGLSSVARKMAEGLKKVCSDFQIFSITDTYIQKECTFLELKGNTPADTIGIRLLANRSLPTSSANNDLFINGNSAFVIAEYIHPGGAHFAFMFAGDATMDTFTYMNKRLTTYQANYTFLNASERVLMLPHHGAIRTACDTGKITGTKPLANQLNAARTFANTVKATHVYASAHYNARRFFHPNLNILELFSRNTEAAPSHENLGFFVRLKDGVPCTGAEHGFTPSYGMRSVTSSTASYTSHTLLTPPNETPLYADFVSYNSPPNDRFQITNLPDKTHQFNSFVCEIDNGVISCDAKNTL